MAARLGVAQRTAKFHVESNQAKLGAETRTEAIVLAARRGLVAL
ncbi:MAG: LuxR C-terminal-related transcriptional regulator [Anaeromyxobacteraceae bacterium]